MKRALFRCDASAALGGGHVMRCLTLANLMRGQGWKVTFCCSSQTSNTVADLREAGFPLYTPDAWPEIEAQDLLIIDHYGISVEEESELRRKAKCLLVIDDYCSRAHVCDIFLNQNLARHPEQCAELLAKNATLLLGPQYALIRPQFSYCRPRALQAKTKRAGRIERILISMGSTDPANLTEKILSTVTISRFPGAVEVLTTSGNPHHARLEALVQQMKITGRAVTLHSDVRAIAELMSTVDFAIGAGGTTSWERCCLGLPSLLFEVAENQREIINALVDEGAAFNGGRVDAFSEASFDAVFKDILESWAAVNLMSKRAAELCDGKGAVRVLKALEELVA